MADIPSSTSVIPNILFGEYSPHNGKTIKTLVFMEGFAVMAFLKIVSLTSIETCCEKLTSISRVFIASFS